MDWSTVLASAGISAVVGALVSLTAVSQVTTRQRRAERRDALRQQLREVVKPWRDDLGRYQLRLNSKMKRDLDTSHIADLDDAWSVLALAEGLPWWRRLLIERRCRKVFGDHYTTLALSLPRRGGDDGWGSLTAWLASAHLEEQGVLDGDPMASALHLAYQDEPGAESQTRLKRHLARLAAGW